METLTFGELVRLLGPWLAVAIFMVVLFKDRIGAILVSRAEMRHKVDEADLGFDGALRAKLLQDSDYSKQLVDRLLDQGEQEKIERRTMSEVVVEQAKATERLAVESVALMRESVDVTRRMADTQRVFANQLTETLQKLDGTLQAIGFLLVQVPSLNRQGQSFPQLVEAMMNEEKGAGQ